MKVVLICPPADLDKTLGKLKGLSSAMPPMGLAYIAANLKKNKFEVDIIDAFAKQMTVEETVEETIKKIPDVVGISCSTPVVPIAHMIAKKLKQNSSNLKIVFGGIHPTLMPDEILKDDSIDYIIRGEGEETFVDLLQALSGTIQISSVLGLSYTINKKIVHNQDRKLIDNLDSIPFPAWEKLPLELYSAPPHWDLKSPCFPILSTRGCPYRCTYCSLKVMGKIYRMRSVKNIVDEIEWLVNNFGAKEIMFMDATFPLKKEHGIAVCQEIIKRGLNKKMVWMCETRVNHVDLEILKMMKKAGCKRVAYGIESGVQELLNNIKKGFILEQVENAVRLTKKAGIEIIAYFMLGLPGETKEKSLQTISFAKKLGVDFVKFNLTVPYPGTELYNQAVAEGTLKSTDWDLFTSFSSMTKFEPVYYPKGMSKNDIEGVQKIALRSYYLSPKIMIKHILKIRSISDIIKYTKGFSSIVKGIIYKKEVCNK
jgi:radical SAM superfamily enzyme YgiQ (UPF0313 family)